MISLIFVLLTGLTLFSPTPAQAEPNQQIFYATNTPDANGRIVHIVQPDDTCLMIELLTGAKVGELIKLNNLDDQCTLKPGMELVLAYYTAPTPTPGPSPTPTQIVPTPTTFNGNGEICVYLFNDVNGNGTPEGTEQQIENGAASITDRSGIISLTGNTLSGTEPLCFTNIPEGDYNISAAPPEGYNPTTAMNSPLSLKAGDRAIINFGAQSGSITTPLSQESEKKNPVLLMAGLILILAGAGIAIYFVRMKRN